LENKPTHPMQLALPLSPPMPASLSEPLRSQVRAALARLLLQVAQTPAPGIPGPQEKGDEHAP
jgi:hypothetical protein